MINYDNQVMYIVDNPSFMRGYKSILKLTHSIRDIVMQHQSVISIVMYSCQFHDIFTQVLPRKSSFLCSKLDMIVIYAPVLGRILVYL